VAEHHTGLMCEAERQALTIVYSVEGSKHVIAQSWNYLVEQCCSASNTVRRVLQVFRHVN